MTPIATDEDLLHLHLDADPADHGARLALSDLYEERGEAAAAEALRWAAAKNRVPFAGSRFPWSWAEWTAPPHHASPDDLSQLPWSLVCAVANLHYPDDAFERVLVALHSRRAAEDALAAAWAFLSPAQRAECWAWNPPPARGRVAP